MPTGSLASHARPLPPETDSLYFLHIPKTAGTSVTKWLVDHIDQERICPAKNWDQLVMLDQHALSKYRVFAGHFGMDFEHFIGRRIAAVTVLRDPLRRTLSHYQHVRRDPDHPLHQHVKHQSFELFVMDRQNLAMIENFQARYLVATPVRFEQFIHCYDRDIVKRHRLSVLSEDARYLLDPVYVRDKAIQSIEQRLALVGTDEFLPDFLHRIGKRLAIGACVSARNVPRENVAPPGGVVETSARSLEIVDTMTKIDKEIYAMVRSNLVGAERDGHYTKQADTASMINSDQV
jgi:sulfotransferase famil protein